MIKKPMLAVAGDNIEAYTYPRLASFKLDGIRALVHPELGLVSRTFKPIPNEFIRRMLSLPELIGLDGEIITYENDGRMRSFNDVQGDVMRGQGMPNYRFHVFDDFTDPELGFAARYDRLVSRQLPMDVIKVRHSRVQNAQELTALRDLALEKGYEGLMTRCPYGKYKQGRSTERQGWLLKHKVWHDAEAQVVGFEELLVNENVAFEGEVGQTKRSSAKAGKVPGNTLGALLVHHPIYGDFKIGTGFDADLRGAIWDDTGIYIGQWVKFKCQLEGAKDKPRFPVFLGFRHEDDM